MMSNQNLMLGSDKRQIPVILHDIY